MQGADRTRKGAARKLAVQRGDGLQQRAGRVVPRGHERCARKRGRRISRHQGVELLHQPAQVEGLWCAGLVVFILAHLPSRLLRTFKHARHDLPRLAHVAGPGNVRPAAAADDARLSHHLHGQQRKFRDLGWQAAGTREVQEGGRAELRKPVGLAQRNEGRLSEELRERVLQAGCGFLGSVGLEADAKRLLKCGTLIDDMQPLRRPQEAG
mmetsp:Transcript_89349/g.253164  ORF Transcript_89349/g.253164 Transcript_89349/m.253164 type:complete len:210 (+) Transcript_89349:2598-3227(+)